MKLRGIDLKMFGDVWEYHVPDHKTEHHGKKRIVMIGQKGQAILQEFLTNDLTAFVFNPQNGRSEFAKRNYRSGSKSAVRNGKNCYAVTGYSSSISRACQKAGVPHWTPNQLRHNFATLARRAGGIEGARTLLGHSSVAVTEVYAERDLDAARAVVAKIG